MMKIADGKKAVAPHVLPCALICAMLCLVAVAGTLTARALAVSKARRALDQRLYADAAHLLAPWYRADLLGNEGTRLLIDSLTASEIDPALAVSAAESCLRDSHDAACALAAGIAYVQLGKPDKAKITFLSLLAKLPGFAAAHAELGKLAQSQGQLDLAAAEFRAAVDYFSDNEKRYGLHLLVGLLVSHGRAAEAGRYLAQLSHLAESEGVLEDLYLVADAYLKTADKAKFVATMESAENLRNKNKLASYYVLTNTELYKRFGEATGHKTER